MLSVNETAVNLCSYFFYTSVDEYQTQFDRGKQCILEMGLPSPSRVYIGSEFCERRLLYFKNLNCICKYFKKNKISITFILPPLSQLNIQSAFESIRNHVEFIDEIAVNDFGSMYLIKKYDWARDKKIIAGRLFDKSIREARFDIFSLEEIRNNELLISSPTITEPHFIRIFHEYGVSRFETDTLPDGVLAINKTPSLDVSIHYPRIYLSSARYCEYASIGLSAYRKFKLNHECSYQCLNQWQEIKVGGRKVIKNGNCIFYNQAQALQTVLHVNFGIRLVYSTCFWEENDENNSTSTVTGSS